MTETLSNWSNTTLYIAIAIYAVAFVLFTLDLAGRGNKKDAAGKALGASAAGATSRARTLVAAGGAEVADSAADSGAGSRSAADAGILTSHAATGQGSGSGAGGGAGAGAGVGTSKSAEGRWRDRRATKMLPLAMTATVIAFAVHVIATVLRGLSAERVPWSNMFEYTMTSTALIVLVFLVVQFFWDLRYLGVFITGLVTLSLGVATTGFYVEVVPLQPALQSVWLVIHVFVASLATGFLALGCGLSVLQLLQQRREKRIRAGGSRKGPMSAMPSAERLEDLAFRVNIVGFIFWTFTLVAGAIWAERAWGRYWGWDTKEVWTFIIWVVYAGYLHARGTRGWRGSPSAWLSIVGFATVIFNFGIVNVFFEGLHAYSGM